MIPITNGRSAQNTSFWRKRIENGIFLYFWIANIDSILKKCKYQCAIFGQKQLFFNLYDYLCTRMRFKLLKITNIFNTMFNSLLETFRSYELALQVYWVMALVASLLFIIQAIMTFMGFDADTDLDAPDVPDGADADFDADGFHLVSVKTIVCFVLGAGWTGVLFWDQIPNRIVLGLVAALVGLAFMALIAWLLYLVLKLDKDNTFRVEKVVGLNADVYLTIPANKAATGKIMVSLDGSMHELEALNADDEKIATGDKVKITGVVQGDVVLVSKL